MSKCYKCGADIDSDSLFCDQCGAEQYVCPKCHIIGKGPNKRCGMCGSPLVPATGQQGNNSTNNKGQRSLLREQRNNKGQRSNKERRSNKEQHAWRAIWCARQSRCRYLL